MKKIIAILLALLLGLSLLAGCGKEKDPDSPDAPAGAKVYQSEYFSFEETGGWYFYEKGTTSNTGLTIELKNDSLERSSIELYATIFKTPEEIVEKLLGWGDAYAQGDNITLGGTEYFVIANEDRGDGYLIATQATTLLDGKGGEKTFVLNFKLSTSLENATPVLESVKINEKYTEIVYEWPESEDVAMDHLTYTASGGWYLNDKFDKPYGSRTKGSLKNDKLRPMPTFMEIKEESRSPKYQLEDDYGIRFLNSEAEQKDNVTINGIEWLVMEDAKWDKTFLITSWRPGLLIDQDGSIVVVINAVGVDGAKPVLESIKLTAEY